MKKISILLIFVIGLVGTIAAQKNNAEAIKKINSVASQISTMQCSFVQTKHLKMLNDKMVSKGVMCYQKSNKLRWEYKSPYSYVFILNNSQVQIKNNKRNDVIDVNRNKVFKEIARIMMNSVVGKCLSDDKDFKTVLTDNGTSWVATMTPLRKNMKQMFQKVVLHFSKAQSMVSSVELYEKNGDKTIIELKNVQVNKPINANLFSVN